MEYRVLSLSKFKEKYINEMILAQLEVYPNEPKVRKEDSIPYEFNSWVVFALDPKENILAGFCAFSICKEARNSNYYGSNLYFYVKKKYRKTTVAGVLLRGAEAYCRNKGCKYFKWDVLIGSDLIKALDKRKEYVKESIIYSTSLI